MQQLRPADRAREQALVAARRLTRAASRGIRTLVQGASHDAAFRDLETAHRALRRPVAAHPALRTHGAVQQAFGEYVEAHLLAAYLSGASAPDADRLQVPPAAYLHGLGDLVGELRRVVLERLRRGDLPGADHAFDSMQKAYEALDESQPPEGVSGARSKTDAARALVERTRGDLVTGKRTHDLEKKIDGLTGLLDEAEGRPPKRRARPRSESDLDLDKAWTRD